MNDSNVEASPRLTTGAPGLDTLLNGGLFESGLYIIQGAAGTGKTILANRMAFHHAQSGKRVIYLTLLAESHNRLLRYIRHLDFFDESVIPGKIQYLSAYAELVESGLKGIVTVIRQMLRKEPASLLILDGLYVAQERVDSKSLFRESIYELQGVAEANNCTMLFLTNGPTSEFNPEHTMVDGFIELRVEQVGIRSVRTISVHKLRGSSFLEGRHMMHIDHSGIVVYPRLESLTTPDITLPRYIPDHTARVSSGLAGLDQMLRGGFPPASTTLIAGPSGSGKTTFGLTYLKASTAENPGVFFGCYETPDELAMKARSIGIDLFEMSQRGALEVVWHRPLESNLDALAARLFDAIDQTKSKRVVLDGVGGFQQTAVFPERLSTFFTALSLLLRQRGVNTVCTAESKEMLRPAELALHELSPVAENIILLRLSESNERLTRSLMIGKMRQSGFDPRIVPYEITDSGIEIQVPA